MSDDPSASEDPCAPSILGADGDKYQNLRIASIFIIFVSSAIGAFFPLLARRTLRLPRSVYDFAKYFGSGVIIATAFIHLLVPAFEALGSPCLTGVWEEYPWAAAIAMMSVFFIFFVELFAFRWGTARMARLNGGKGAYDTHGHAHGTEGLHAAHGPESEMRPVGGAAHSDIEEGVPVDDKKSDIIERRAQHSGHGHEEASGPLDDHPLAQILSILILEFGVIFHSFITGITLAVSVEFIPLFLVLIFHQLFEGLGLGTRLAHLAIFTQPREDKAPVNDEGSSIPHKSAPRKFGTSRAYALFPWLGALAFSLTLPLGVAVGLGVRNSYDPNSSTANIVSGIFDSFSSGILLYTGLVELLAHEFLFNRAMREAPLGRVLYAGFCVMLGAALMSLLGRWA